MSATVWSIVVWYLLPPPLVLTLLLLIPVPQIVKRGLLAFTRNVLYFNMVGNAKLVHVILLACGLSLIGSGQHTYRLGLDAHSETASELTPNQRINLLARKWREERNFWIAALTFLLWAMLYRFYNLLMDHMKLQDKVRILEGGAPAGGPPPPPGAAPSKVKAEPSAPPMPAAEGAKAAKAATKAEPAKPKENKKAI